MPIPVWLQVQSDPAASGTGRPSQESLEAFLFDISEAGIGLLAQSSLPWGTLVALEFPRSAFPFSDRSSSEGLMRITGRVIHAIPYAGRYRLGISFIRLDDADRSLIRRLSSPPPLPQDRRQAPRIRLLEETA